MFDAALAAAEVAEEVFGAPVTIFLPEDGRISFRKRTSDQLLISTAEEEIAQEVFDHGRKAGKETEEFPGCRRDLRAAERRQPHRRRDGDSARAPTGKLSRRSTTSA